MKNLLITQFVVILIGIVIAFLLKGESVLLAALYGGAVALGNTLMLSGRMQKVDEIAKTDPQRSVYSLYFGVIQRFVFVLVALGLGLGYLQLDPQALLGVFIVAQLAHILANMRNAIPPK